MKVLLTLVLILTSCVCFELKNNLSEYNIYSGNPKNLSPSEKYIPYDLITPLFTDYAFKHRLIYIPANNQVCTVHLSYCSKITLFFALFIDLRLLFSDVI